jgi:glycosyltransferase involved in cell wall biosynthesis
MSEQKRKILLIAMADSVHVARWLDVAADFSQHEVLLIPSSPHRRIHPRISEIARSYDQEGQVGLRIHTLLKFLSLPIWILDRMLGLGAPIRAWFIGHTLKTFKPDLVHIMESQNGGYPFTRANRGFQTDAKKVLTLFGSDIFWYSRFQKHKALLVELLGNIDLLAAECDRDLNLAKRLGYTGSFLPLTPVSGGIKTEQIAETDSHASFQNRKTIAIKGYGGTWGEGALAIEALGDLATELMGYRVEIFSSGWEARRSAKRHLIPAGIDYVIHKKASLNHSEMLHLFRASRIYVGVSKSDGLPASLLEAMSQGAYPIQTGTACIQGWFEPGFSGSRIDLHSVAEIKSAIAFALANDSFLLEAQKANLARIVEGYSQEKLRLSFQPNYENLLTNS